MSSTETNDMAMTNHERVGKALELLKRGLGPFVQHEFTNIYKDNAAIEASKFIGEDRMNAKKQMMEWDVSALLKLMWESWHNVFRQTLGRSDRSLVSELRDHRNKWAHQGSFSSDDTYRVLDSAGRLLVAISASQVNEIEKMKTELLRVRFDEQVLSEKCKSTGLAIESSEEGLEIVGQPLNQEEQCTEIPVQPKRSRVEPNRGHSQGHSWNHNSPEKQDGFINGLFKDSITLKEIQIAFVKRFPDHANPTQRVRRHINHLKKDHRDFPYEEMNDGKFVQKKK